MTETTKIAFLFAGQGAQSVGMGKDLYEAYPVVRELYDRCSSDWGLSVLRDAAYLNWRFVENPKFDYDIFAVRGPGGGVVEIASASQEDWPRRVADFRFRELARFVPSEALRFTISFAGESVPTQVEARRSEARDWQFGAEALAPGYAQLVVAARDRLSQGQGDGDIGRRLRGTFA